MNFWLIAGMLIGGYLLQFYFGALQIKDFTKAYTPIKKRGRVAIGRVSGMVRAGAIVFLGIDEKGVIFDGSYMMGVTVLAKFRNFSDLNGKDVGSITEEDLLSYAKPLRRAILDASSNYNIIMSGGEIPRKLSPLEKFNNLFTKKKKAVE